jgi:hypothetical protein
MYLLLSLTKSIFKYCLNIDLNIQLFGLMNLLITKFII